MKRMTKSLLMVAMGWLAGACGIDEMHQYRDSIEQVRVEARVDAPVDLEVAPPATALGPETEWDASDVALEVTERFIVDRFAVRLADFSREGSLRAAVGAVAAEDMALGLDWRVAPAGQPHDARFEVVVDSMQVSVDARGQADVTVQMSLHGWFVPEGRKIYEQWTWHGEPLFASWGGPVYPNTPEGQAAERAYNLMVLSDMPPAVLRDALLTVAEEAASAAVRELSERTWR